MQANEFVKDTFELTSADCYTFFIYDEGGNGLSNGGYFALRQSNFSLIFENYEFDGAEEGVQFSTSTVSVEEARLEEGFTVFPNPFDEQTFISFSLDRSREVEITVYNVIGEVVNHLPMEVYSTGTHSRTFNANGLNSGIYFVQVRIDEKVLTRKISMK